MAYLDPKNALTFKKVFGKHPDLLRSLLNALLPLPDGRQIETLENVPAEQSPVVPRFGNTLLDIRCTDNSGAPFLVNVQMLWTNSFKVRVHFEGSKAFVKQLSTGSYEEDLPPTYALYFVNEAFQPDETVFYHYYPVVNTDGTEQPIEGLQFLFVELLHFRLPVTVEKEMAKLWLRYFTEIGHDTPDAAEALLQNAATKKALDLLQEDTLSPAEREDYDRYWDAIAEERRNRDELIRRAIMQVKQEELGKGVRLQKIATASKMIEKGFDDTTISEFIELTLSEIQTLRRTGTLD